MYKKGTFIYRLAGREREKSASYYTPEVLTKCLVKYALKELLEGKTADEILELTICEPAMGSAAFLNEAINQLAEAYISRKEQETGEIISYENRFNELQKVKMYIADRNVYGIDLNPVAVELAEVSLWLNTIYEGGYVPWFGTQLINGNSLIGARRQVYSEAALTTTSKGLRWYENAPERVPVGTERKKRRGSAQIYHFLLGDPGMCDYTDKVIKQLEPENIKYMKEWNKKFTAPYSDDELETLKTLSNHIDNLWKEQIALRKELETKTRDTLSVFGHKDTIIDSHTSIREKDKILSELYRSEHMKNAGPYARLKFAMDYWCALWFWPVDKAALLPSRSEFLFDMSLILEGTLGSVSFVDDTLKGGQMSLFATSEAEQLAMEFSNQYGFTDSTVVDIPRLCANSERLDLAREIAEQNKFMHWELEFADLFAERGGFDLVIGNPPWIKLVWNEQSLLADSNPIISIRKLTATQVANKRAELVQNRAVRQAYYAEYESVTGMQNFFGAVENYWVLAGNDKNLYKCFIPQAIDWTHKKGVFAFVHPNTIFDESKGGALRRVLYPKLRKSFRFQNELRLFEEVGHAKTFCLSVFSNEETAGFDWIANLFTSKTIDECYVAEQIVTPELGIKNADGEWNTKGHKDRIIRITPHELKTFAKVFDDSDEWQEAKLPVVQTMRLVDLLNLFSDYPNKVGNMPSFMGTTLWSETGAQEDGTIERFVHFASDTLDAIVSGPHIGVANPLYQTAQRDCSTHGAFDSVDLTAITDNYFPRYNYRPMCSVTDYYQKAPISEWGENYLNLYKVLARRRINKSQERTLISAVFPPRMGHVNTVSGVISKSIDDLLLLAGAMESLPCDALIKILGKDDLYFDSISKLPIFRSQFNQEIIARVLLLNSLSASYAELWNRARNLFSDNKTYSWASTDSRLSNVQFEYLHSDWRASSAIRTPYARRQAMLELDVLVAMALGMDIELLKSVYLIQFPVMQAYESDTWFDANGNIAFTNNRSLVGVGVDRKQFELEMKDAPAGKKFYRTIIDDTMPGGPVERTIEYVAPFDRCDREKDYEIAWKFFEEKYGNTK